jgi:hypothetical protein
LSVFAYDVHDHVTLSFALKWFFGFAAVFTGACCLIVYSSPGKIAVPRTFPYNGLEKELGGPNNPVWSNFLWEMLNDRHVKKLKRKEHRKKSNEYERRRFH